MLSLYEILKASKTGIAPDMWTALAGMNWGGADSGHEVKELTGIPPLSFRADGTPLLDYLISGNTVQTGTPTPSNPVEVNGVGVRTENLWSGDVFKKLIFDVSYYRNADENSNVIYIPVIGGNTYTFSISNTVQGTSFTSVCSIDKPALDGTYVVNGTNTFIRHGEVTTFTRTIPEGANWWAIQIRSLNNLSNNIMINEGSTALPYEPYGYKLDISSSGDNLIEPFENFTWTASNCVIISNMNNQILLDGNGYTGSSFSQAISTSKSIPLSLIGKTVTFSGSITWQSEGAIAPRVTLAIERSGSSDYNINIYQGRYSYSFDIPNDATGYHFIVRIDQNRSEYVGTAKVTFSNIMLNEGSTALPYEPYNHITTPIYLGEVETTRKIKKLVLDGTEIWSGYSSSTSGIGASLLLTDILSNSRDNGFCTHFSPQYSPSQSTIDGVTFGAGNKALYITFSVTSASVLNITDTASIKAWLAAQYAAGTPVTIWYVLATPETATVNEPFMKIGDYADTISMEQAGVQIPTNNGNTVIDVETTLKPSQMYIKYQQ